jgi:hypothetical protein
LHELLRSRQPGGLGPNEEVTLVEVEPAPSDDLYVWTHGVRVEGLPQLNFGHPTARFLEDAARDGEDPEDYLCFGDASGSGGCSIEDPEDPSITGLTFGGADVLAWSWDFVPDGAVAVRFIDQDGVTSWQRPLDGTVILPDTMDDPDADCLCRLDAIGDDGEVIISVDVESSSYIDDLITDRRSGRVGPIEKEVDFEKAFAFPDSCDPQSRLRLRYPCGAVRRRVSVARWSRVRIRIRARPV